MRVEFLRMMPPIDPGREALGRDAEAGEVARPGRDDDHIGLALCYGGRGEGGCPGADDGTLQEFTAFHVYSSDF